MPKTIKTKVRKRVKFTKEELKLLEYPPTERTWVCENHSGGLANSGIAESCFFCGKAKDKNPILLWTTYASACEKLGIKPLTGTWVQIDNFTGRLFMKGGRAWKTYDIPFVGEKLDLPSSSEEQSKFDVEPLVEKRVSRKR